MKRSVFLLLDHYPETGETQSDVYDFALEHARLADELGFDAFWIAEHHFGNLGSVPNPAVLLAAIARQTDRLRIGPAVSILPYRDPLFVAEDYATVDILSAGRLNMGVGCGAQQNEFAGLGVDFDRRWHDYQANLGKLRDLWCEPGLWPMPVQSPPPLYVATTNPENVRAAGRNGDSVITLISPGAGSVPDFGKLIGTHRRGLSEGGHAPGSAEIVAAMVAHVAPSDREARASTEPALARFLTALSKENVDAAALYGDIQRAATGCFGTVERAGNVVSTLAQGGLEHVAFITRFGGMDAASAHRSLRLLAQAAGSDRAVTTPVSGGIDPAEKGMRRTG